MFRGRRGGGGLVAGLVVPLVRVVASVRGAAVRLGGASSVWSGGGGGEGEALASMLVKLLNDLALRAGGLRNVGPGLNIVKKYEKDEK